MLTNLEEKYDYSDVLIVPNDSDVPSRSRVKLERDYTFKWSSKKKIGVGIIAANMDTVGTIAMAQELATYGCFTALHKHHTPDKVFDAFRCDSIREYAFYTMGTSEQEQKQLEIMVKNRIAPEMVCIDIANGHLNIILDAIKRVRAAHPDLIIMAGNVVTAERAVKVIEAGADIVKVGIGPGSACTTRRQTGVGYPQLSAVYECAKAVEAIDGLVCADGGCTVPGDVAKAFIAGADFVMLGGMLAGHSECEGILVDYRKELSKDVRVFIDDVDSDAPHLEWAGRFYHKIEELPAEAWKLVPLEKPEMIFYGMASETAMRKHNGGIADYRSAEGRTVQVPYRGSVRETISNILGGLRSTMTYVGIQDIKNLAYSARFVKTRHQLNTVFVK